MNVRQLVQAFRLLVGAHGAGERLPAGALFGGLLCHHGRAEGVVLGLGSLLRTAGAVAPVLLVRGLKEIVGVHMAGLHYRYFLRVLGSTILALLLAQALLLVRGSAHEFPLAKAVLGLFLRVAALA